MGRIGTRTGTASWRWLALALALAACGDDGGGAPNDAMTPAGETCLQAGFTMTGCPCDAGRPGRRTCQDDLVWGPCVCPPPISERACVEGQRVLCDPCPGDAEKWETRCLQGGTFDCSCDGPGDGDGDDMDAGAATDGG
ncbi:MAG: hypothetical protein PVI30_09435 [Myxococcales bacterium]|jgi:hypothetical protein